MTRKPRQMVLCSTVGSLLLSTLPPQAASVESLQPENAINDLPSRCYWLERGLADEGLCGQKMKPDLSLMGSEAEDGNAFAAFRLGQLYSSGNWGVEQDFAKARYWYARAAEGGGRAAQIRLGQAHEFGRLGLERNPRQAIRYYEMATEYGIYPDLEERLDRLRARLGSGE